MTERRGRRCKQLLDDLKEKRGYWKLKAEALDRTVWRTWFGTAFGSLDNTDYVLNGSTRLKYSTCSYILGYTVVKYFLVGTAQSAQWLGYGLDDRGVTVRLPAGVTDILFCKLSIPAVGPTWSPCSVGAWDSFLEGKATREWSWRLVKNEWICTSTFPYAIMASPGTTLNIS